MKYSNGARSSVSRTFSFERRAFGAEKESTGPRLKTTYSRSVNQIPWPSESGTSIRVLERTDVRSLETTTNFPDSSEPTPA